MCTSGGHQCKTVPIPGLYILVHTKQTWTFPLNDITIKVAKCTNIRKKLIHVISSNFWFVLIIFCVSLQLYEHTIEIQVIKCHNKNMAVLPNRISIKSATAQKYGIKAYNFFTFWVYF